MSLQKKYIKKLEAKLQNQKNTQNIPDGKDTLKKLINEQEDFVHSSLPLSKLEAELQKIKPEKQKSSSTKFSSEQLKEQKENKDFLTKIMNQKNF